MNTKLFKKTVPACLALLLVSGNVSMLPVAQVAENTVITASAEESSGTSYFDATTKTLFLKGTLWKYAKPAPVMTPFPPIARLALPEGVERTDVKHIKAESGVVLPADSSFLFSDFSNATDIDLANADTSSVTNMNHMFGGCGALKSLDLSSFDTSNVTNMSNMFCYCTALKSLDLSSFDTSNVTDMSYMFQHCTALTSVYASKNWSSSRAYASMSMFLDCNNLTGGAGTKYDKSHTDKRYAQIDGLLNSPGYFSYKTLNSNEVSSINYNAHVQNYGWLGSVSSPTGSDLNTASQAGTTGQSLRMEALIINLTHPNGESGISYRAHVENYGWMNWCTSGQTAGTTGQSLRMEAIEISLDDEYAANYDVYYQVHMAGIGWGNWAKNGETAGTTGQSRAIEAIRIQLVPKQ